MTKHQALYELLTKELGHKKDVQVESGFEGDSLWVDEEEEWSFLSKKDSYEGWVEDEAIESQVYESCGWYFWKTEENG